MPKLMTMALMLTLIFVFLCCVCDITFANSDAELLVVAVATEPTDGLIRLNKSAVAFQHKLHVFGLGETWSGGDMRYQGGGQKIRILWENLAKYSDRAHNLVILFMDAYDVIINADAESILRKFFREYPDKRVVFGAESFCWPDRTLAPKYPPVVFGERYLNSGLFIGYANEVLQMLQYANEQFELKDDDDDQLIYTKIYLDQESRLRFKIGLDSLAFIFQNLNGAQEFVEIVTDGDGDVTFHNSLYNTNPIILHGNGPSKTRLNVLGNYLFRTPRFAPNDLSRSADTVTLPSIAVAVFVTKLTPYMEEFLQLLGELDYPKDRMHIRILNGQPYSQQSIEQFVGEWDGFFASLETINPEGLDRLREHDVRAQALGWAESKDVAFLFMLDADSHLSNQKTLQELVRTAVESDNYYGILAPLLLRPGTLFSNYWGAVSETGYYARAPDYVDIVEGRLPGLWNVPFVGSAFLIARKKFAVLKRAYRSENADADIAFAEFCRDNGHFMYIDASKGPNHFGYLVNSDGFAHLPSVAKVNLELYDFPTNRKLWEKRYIHEEYFPLLDPAAEVPLACPDVYDFPFLSPRFCQEIIEVMENFGVWSEGKHQDKRLQGGYENVPTRDIHMNQVGFERHWLQILDEYVAPIQEKVFVGFYQRPIHSNMMFVVRYRPDEQASLRPHHDASTYSIDVALNQLGADFEGGGVRYVRYNCTVPADRVGWSMLFPGRLTHLHEGLPTTKGTRYILVSFINP